MKKNSSRTAIEKKKNLSDTGNSTVPNAKWMRVGIVVSEWNPEVTLALRDGAIQTLKKHGVPEKNISLHYVPGSFELTLGAHWLASQKNMDAVICLGCVIQGETRHFDFICDAVSHGITDVNLRFGKPVVFGVLTTQNMEQALARSGGKHGNKGDEAAITAIKMASLKKSLKKKSNRN